ncbi:MAG TPA: hypothetical protein VFE47_01805 [Tepidisphaeraceae bacterium]|nr:hypothetical protein [Tepidisphaeraceae bacterium]
MNTQQRLFLVQGQSSFVVFIFLRKNPAVAPCHALHYLQMSTELLAPTLAVDGPNPEYPWPRSMPKIAPVEH